MTDSEIVVSISCITYNHSKYIRECLDGFLIQKTKFDFEILIYDDASTDGTQEIIKDFQKKSPLLIKPIYSTENQYSKGVRGINLEFNIPRAKGRYVALCEGDDCWVDPYKLQKQVDFLEANPDFVLSFHEVEKINSEGKLLGEKVLGESKHRDLNQEELIMGELVPTVSAVIKSEFFKKISKFPKNLLNGDTFLFAILGQYGKAHFHPDIKPAKYRIHEGGVWSGSTDIQKKEAVIHTFETLRKYIKPEFVDIVNKSLFEKYIIQFTRLPYSGKQKARLYFRFILFSISNGLLYDYAKIHWFVLKRKLNTEE